MKFILAVLLAAVGIVGAADEPSRHLRNRSLGNSNGNNGNGNGNGGGGNGNGGGSGFEKEEDDGLLASGPEDSRANDIQLVAEQTGKSPSEVEDLLKVQDAFKELVKKAE